MRAIVDTNVVAYYLLNTQPHVEECRQFWKRILQVAAPASWQAEILSVVWMAVRKGVLTRDDALYKLRIAARLGIQTVPICQLWRGALVRSIHSDIPPYDILFVELADRRKIKLATFDVQLIRAFPEIAKRPAAIF
jgi:predicted nucleic acid-binding protein